MIIVWLLFIIAFAGTFFVMPHSIRKLREGGYQVEDMYKIEKPMVPTNAGMIIIFTAFISIALLPVIIRVLGSVSLFEMNLSDLSKTNLAFLLVVSIYAMYGLLDDLLDIGRIMKLVLPISFGYPLISVISPESVLLPLIGEFDLANTVYGEITWSDLFRIIIIPIYVMVVANLVNMHSGYNGLQSGLSTIIVFTLLVKSWMDGKLEGVIPGGAFLGSMLALWYFNKYPSKVFEGNIGSLLFGSVIGCIIVIQEFWWFGFFILIPHTFNFVLWLIWLILIRRKPETYLEKDGKHRKFGEIGTDGNLDVPNRLTLKWIPNYYYRIGECNSVLIQYFITGLFCLLALLVF